MENIDDECMCDRGVGILVCVRGFQFMYVCVCVVVLYQYIGYTIVRLQTCIECTKYNVHVSRLHSHVLALSPR